MSMADDDNLSETASQIVERERKFWYQAGSRQACYDTSYAMNAWFWTIHNWWNELETRLGVEGVTLRANINELSLLKDNLEQFGHRLLMTEFQVFGMNNDDELVDNGDIDHDLVVRYVELCFSIWKRLERSPKLYQGVWGCRKGNDHFVEIRSAYSWRKVAEVRNEKMPDRPQVETLYSLIKNSDYRLQVVFDETGLPQDLLAKCECQECKACCGAKCKCRYEHHSDLECPEIADDDCDIRGHFFCIGCEPDCECC